MDTLALKTILLEEMQAYAGKGLNAHSVLTHNDAEQIYTIIDFATVRGKRIVSTVLITRLLENQIVIDVDRNNKPLVDALVAHGVSAKQITLAYLHDESVINPALHGQE